MSYNSIDTSLTNIIKEFDQLDRFNRTDNFDQRINDIAKQLSILSNTIQQNIQNLSPAKIRLILSKIQTIKHDIETLKSPNNNLKTATTRWKEIEQLAHKALFQRPPFPSERRMAAVPAPPAHQASVEEIFRKEAQFRSKLARLRNQTQAGLKDGIRPELVAKETSQELRELISSLYQEAIENLKTKGHYPPCRFSLVFFGSLARNESGPYPDLDHMLLVDQKTDASLRYFQKVNQMVADRIYRLGESRSLGKPGLRYCEGGMNPLYKGYYYRYAANPEAELEGIKKECAELEQKIKRREKELQGVPLDDPQHKEDPKVVELNVWKLRLDSLKSSEAFAGNPIAGAAQLYGEPKKFAHYMVEIAPYKHNSFEKNIAHQVFDPSCSDTVGDPKLFRQYQEEIDKIFDTAASQGDSIRQQIVFRRFVELMEWVEPSAPIAKNQSDMIENVKNTFYRFPQIVVSSLATYYQCESTNSFDRIRELKAKGHLHPDYADRLLQSMEFILKARIKLQLAHQEEFEAFQATGLFKDLVKRKNELDAKIENTEKAIRDIETQLRSDQAHLDKIANQLEFKHQVQKLSENMAANKKQLDKLKKSLKEDQRNLEVATKIMAVGQKDTMSNLFSPEELTIFDQEILPFLHELYQITQASMSQGSGFVNVFKGPQAFSKPITVFPPKATQPAGPIKPSTPDTPAAQATAQAAQKTESANPWANIEVVKAEADALIELLKPGGTLRGIIQGGDNDPLALLDFPVPDEVLPSGKTLYGGEIAAIFLYTTDAYKMINGMLARDDSQFQEFLDIHKIPKEQVQTLKTNAMQVAKLMASGLNKLPAFTGSLYRGDYITPGMLEQYRHGRVDVNTRYMSSSTSPKVGLDFAKSGIAEEDAKNPGHNFEPVLFVIHSENSKDIKKYSRYRGEDERVYLPQQALQSISCDKQGDTHLIYLKELNETVK